MSQTNARVPRVVRYKFEDLLNSLIRLGHLLEYEPTWLSEACFALGAILWGFLSLITPDYTVHGWAILLPICSICMGTTRLWVLRYDQRELRIFFAMANALMVAWLIVGLYARFKIAPNESWLFVVFVCEVLTLGKFSMPYVREAMKREE